MQRAARVPGEHRGAVRRGGGGRGGGAALRRHPRQPAARLRARGRLRRPVAARQQEHARHHRSVPTLYLYINN